MKRIITTAIAASMMLAGISAAAQVNVGAGYINSVYKTKVSNTKTTSPSNGFYAGVDYNIPIVGGLGMAPGIYYTLTSSTETSSIGTWLTGTGTTTEMYIGVPVNFNYAVEVADGIKGFIFAGPTFNVGISSKYKASGAIAGISATKTTDMYKDNDYSRFEMLLGGGIGLQYNAFRLTVGYDANLLNRYTGDVSDYTVGRNQLHVGLGYSF